MIMLADTPVSSMTDLELNMMLEDIQAEMRNRKVKESQSMMMSLCEEIQKVQMKKNYDICLIDHKGQEIPIHTICEIYDRELEVGYAFSDPSIYEEKEITNNEDKSSVIDAKEDEIKRDNEGRVICIHRDDDEVGCSNCEYRKYCWPNSWEQL